MMTEVIAKYLDHKEDPDTGITLLLLKDYSGGLWTLFGPTTYIKKGLEKHYYGYVRIEFNSPCDWHWA